MTAKPQVRRTALKLPFGRRSSDGRFVDVTAVPNGKDCGCTCPVCGLGIIAKNNPKNVKVAHFAHTADCATAYETVIHETAKQIIREIGSVWLPASIIAPRTKFAFKNHTLEKRYDRLVPDVTVWNREKEKLAVEIFVTHAVGPEKLLVLKKLQLSCVEYDLSALPREITYDQLRTMFAEDKIRVTWIFNRRARLEELRRSAETRRKEAEIMMHNKQVLSQAREEAKERTVYVRKNRYGYSIYHIDPCPKGVRQGGIANVNLDCKGCRFCFGVNLQNRVPVMVRCGGHKAGLLRTLDQSDLERAGLPSDEV